MSPNVKCDGCLCTNKTVRYNERDGKWYCETCMQLIREVFIRFYEGKSEFSISCY